MMNPSMKITLLGTGTSQGVPVIACDCKVCRSIDRRDKRLRTSVMIETEGKVFVIDTGPDFRQQMLTHDVKTISAILYTHEHKDHVAGLDDVRAFNFKLNKTIDIYAEKRVHKSLRREYAYIFASDKYPGIPDVKMHSVKNEPFDIEGVKIIPIRAYHYKLPVFGYRVNNFAYFTDVKTVPEREKLKLKNLDVLILTALRKEEHISHMNLKESLALINEVKPASAFLIHLSHSFGLHAEEEATLPAGVKIAYDGLILTL